MCHYALCATCLCKRAIACTTGAKRQTATAGELQRSTVRRRRRDLFAMDSGSIYNLNNMLKCYKVLQGVTTLHVLNVTLRYIKIIKPCVVALPSEFLPLPYGQVISCGGRDKFVESNRSLFRTVLWSVQRCTPK